MAVTVVLAGARIGQRLALLDQQSRILHPGRWMVLSTADAPANRGRPDRVLHSRLEGCRLKGYTHAAVAVAAVALSQAAHLHAPAGAHMLGVQDITVEE